MISIQIDILNTVTPGFYILLTFHKDDGALKKEGISFDYEKPQSAWVDGEP